MPTPQAFKVCDERRGARVVDDKVYAFTAGELFHLRSLVGVRFVIECFDEGTERGKVSEFGVRGGGYDGEYVRGDADEEGKG
jgi:hypothetical protein